MSSNSRRINTKKTSVATTLRKPYTRCTNFCAECKTGFAPEHQLKSCPVCEAKLCTKCTPRDSHACSEHCEYCNDSFDHLSKTFCCGLIYVCHDCISALRKDPNSICFGCEGEFDVLPDLE